MRANEFLRSLIDMVDAKQGGTSITVNIDTVNIASDAEKPNPDDVENAMDRDDVFVPPLQAKLEIMKKMAGIEPKNQDLLTSQAEEDEPFEG